MDRVAAHARVTHTVHRLPTSEGFQAHRVLRHVGGETLQVMLASSYLSRIYPAIRDLEALAPGVLRAISIFGSAAQALFQASSGLAALGVPVEWHLSAGIGHGIDQEGLRHGGEFLARRAPKAPTG